MRPRRPHASARREQQAQRLVGDAVLGVVEVEARRLGGQALAALRGRRRRARAGGPRRQLARDGPRSAFHARRLVDRSVSFELRVLRSAGSYPAADGPHQPVGLGRAPGARLVVVDAASRRRGSDRRSPRPPRPRPGGRTAWRRPPSRRRAAARRRPSRRRVGWWTTRSSVGSPTIASPGTLDARAERDGHVGAQAEADVVAPASRTRDVASGGRLSVHHHLGGGHRQALAGADEERHALPAPRVDRAGARRRRSRPSESGATPGSSR